MAGQQQDPDSPRRSHCPARERQDRIGSTVRVVDDDQLRPRPTNHVVELGGVGTLPHSYQCVAYEGEIKLIGVMTLPEGDLSPYPLMFKSASLRGIFVGRRHLFVDLLKAVAQNGIEPVIDKVFDFDDSPAAYEYLRSAGHFGKIVIRIAS